MRSRGKLKSESFPEISKTEVLPGVSHEMDQIATGDVTTSKNPAIVNGEQIKEEGNMFLQTPGD